jgi:hypothetical protein
MARTKAVMSMPPAIVAVGVKVAKPHGMSLQAKPQRTPHPTAKGRDRFGRMLPGQLPANAAPPFQPGMRPQAQPPVARAATRVPPPPKPAPMPMAPPPPRGQMPY